MRDAILEQAFLIKTLTAFEPKRREEEDLAYVIQATAGELSALLENRLRLADVRRNARKLRMRFAGISGGDSGAEAEAEAEPDSPVRDEAEGRGSPPGEGAEEEGGGSSGDSADGDGPAETEGDSAEGPRTGDSEAAEEGPAEGAPGERSPRAAQGEAAPEREGDFRAQIKSTWHKLFGKPKEVDARFVGISSEDYLRSLGESPGGAGEDSGGAGPVGESRAVLEQESPGEGPGQSPPGKGGPDSEEAVCARPKLSLREKLGLSPAESKHGAGRADLLDWGAGPAEKSPAEARPVAQSDFLDLIDFGAPRTGEPARGPRTGVRGQFSAEDYDFL